MSCTSLSGPASAPGSVSSSAPAASFDATSPACAPPIPSATAKSGGCTTYESSLCRRFRPVSLARAYAPTVIPRTAIPFRRCARRRRRRACAAGRSARRHEGAVRRADVGHPDTVTARLDAGMACRRELVAVDRDGALRRPADRHRRGVDRELLPLLEHRAVRDDEATVADLLPDRAAGERGAKDEALLRQAHVATGRAHDAPDEEIEQHEERDLQDEQRALVRRARERAHSRSVEKAISVE